MCNIEFPFLASPACGCVLRVGGRVVRVDVGVAAKIVNVLACVGVISRPRRHFLAFSNSSGVANVIGVV